MLAAVGAAIALTIVSAGASYVALTFGWHPFPDTAIGCSLHKRFNPSSGRIHPETFIESADCLTVTLRGREVVIRDATRAGALRSWLAAREDLWRENVVPPTRDPGDILLTIRRCTQRDTLDEHVWANEDWLGAYPGKALMRPTCRSEWRELDAIVSP